MVHRRSAMALRAPHPAALVAALMIAALALIGAPANGGQTPRARAEGTVVRYKAGWNLVAAPSGTNLDQAAAQVYAYGPASEAYQAISRNQVIGGRAVWAFFAKDTDVTLGQTAATFTRLILPAGRLAMIGNPSATDTLTLSGADMALAYDTAQGAYVPVTELRPGQGAWVLRRDVGDVALGRPSNAQAAEAIRKIQAGLTQDAADVSNFAAIPAVAEGMIAARQYDLVQTATDDIRAAFADGLLLERAAEQPQLSDLQLAGAVSSREAVARAKAKTVAGDLAGADADIEAARRAATAAAENAETLARAQGSGQSVEPLTAELSYAAYTPASLARYGKLCDAATLALALNLPPSSEFVGLVVAVLNNQPLPPAQASAASAAPANPAATALPATSAGPAPTTTQGNCTGNLTLAPTAGSMSVQLTLVAGGLDPSSPYSVFFSGRMLSLSPTGTQSSPATTDAQGNLTVSLTVQLLAPAGQTPVQVATAKRCVQAFFSVLSPGRA